MKKYFSIISLTAATLLVTVVAAISLTGGATGETDRIDALVATGPGPLDGLRFAGMLGPKGKPLDRADTFIFEDGTFVSKECELICKYPARPYQAEQMADGWIFESTTRCPYKDATIVWRGKVTDDRIEGVATWTLKRWYWSIERDFSFEARLQNTVSFATDGT